MDVAFSSNRGVVVAFRATRRPRVPRWRPRMPGAPAAPVGVHDDQVNADWDLLIRVASHAWSWRDPESLDTLEQAVVRLRTWIDRDWTA